MLRSWHTEVLSLGTLTIWAPEPVSSEPIQSLDETHLFLISNKPSWQVGWQVFTVVIQGQKHAVVSIRLLYPSVSQQTHPMPSTPDWLVSFYSSHPLEHPSASLSLLMMFLPSLSHQRFSLMVLVILLVIRTAQSVGSHLECLTQKPVRPQRLLRLQQTFNSCLNQVPVLWNMGFRDRKSVGCNSPYGWLTECTGKVVILFGKALKGKINEYSAWMLGDRDRRREFITMEWASSLPFRTAEKEFPKHDTILCVLPAFNHLNLSNVKSFF